MSAASRTRSWWRGLFHRDQDEAEIQAELEFHIESYAADLERQGMRREEALRRARLELGGIAVQKEEARASIGLRPWDDFTADVRYAVRQLRHAPGFTLTVVLVLSLGIGVNAAMFSVLDATLLRWLPYPRAGELAILDTANAKGEPGSFSYADFEEWQQQQHTLTGIAAYGAGSLYLRIGNDDEIVSAPVVAGDLFSVLGVNPVKGRGFLDEEHVPGKGKVMVLSDRVWRRLYLADPDIVGKQVTANNTYYTVVGIMPPGFAFPIDDPVAQVWVPLEVTPNHHLRNFTTPPYRVIGRLRPGLGLDALRADLGPVQQRLSGLYHMGAEAGPSRVTATPYRDSLGKQTRPALKALMLAVAIIWLIACANVANLMLARGMARQRELAVRGALGASPWRLLRQLLTESLLLSLAGAAAGLALSQIALSLFDKTLSTRLNLPDHLAPNATVLAALLGLSLLSALVFGFLPAWLATRTPIEHAMRQGVSQAGTSRSRHRLQQAMVVAEIGMSLVLLIASGLLLRTVFALRKVPLGFQTDHVLIVQPDVPRYRYRGRDMNSAVYTPLLERVKQTPGVRSAALTTIVPLDDGFDIGITFSIAHGEQSQQPPTAIHAKLRAAGPELQHVLGFRMAQGRFFNQFDTADTEPVAVVNRAFARLYARDESIIDRFKVGLGGGRVARIVGVMDDFHQASIAEPSVPEIDLCAPQLKPGDNFYQPVLSVHVELAIRTEADPAAMIPELRRGMAELNPDLTNSTFTTMDQVVEDSMGSQLLAARLLEAFAGSALLVALVGLYGLLTYLVTQRTPELGVRLALGAQRVAIIQLVLRQASWMLLAGVALGGVLALFAGKTLATFLYGVKPGDMATLLSVSAVLLVSGLLAAYLPARRASRVDPLEALRQS